MKLEMKESMPTTPGLLGSEDPSGWSGAKYLRHTSYWCGSFVAALWQRLFMDAQRVVCNTELSGAVKIAFQIGLSKWIGMQLCACIG